MRATRGQRQTGQIISSQGWSTSVRTDQIKSRSSQVRSNKVTLISKSCQVHVRSGYVRSSSGHVEIQNNSGQV